MCLIAQAVDDIGDVRRIGNLNLAWLLLRTGFHGVAYLVLPTPNVVGDSLLSLSLSLWMVIRERSVYKTLV
ncbi:hypothetical protein GCM10007159_18460 [Modicisalibacter luteus]|nr:hypothetical protein GCM10007159_18460 [Halomonas lutea]